MAEDLRDIGEDRSILLLDDDEPFLRRLAKAMEKRGFEVETAGSVAAGKAIATARPPAYAVCDLRLGDGNGLDVVEAIRERRPDSRIVVLTGYGAIATAVAAVKIGATDYLSKPADFRGRLLDMSREVSTSPHFLQVQTMLSLHSHLQRDLQYQQRKHKPTFHDVRVWIQYASY